MGYGMIVLVVTHSLTKWYFNSTFLARFILSEFLAQLFATVLSQFKLDVLLQLSPCSASRLHSRFVSEQTSHIAVYSASGVDGAAHFCLRLFQES